MFEAADRVGVQQQFALFLRRERAETVVTALEPEPFEAMLLYRVVGVGGRWEQGEMDLEGVGVLEHPGQAIAWRSPTTGMEILQFLPGSLGSRQCSTNGRIRMIALWPQ